MMLSAENLVNFVIIIMLFVMIIYCIILNRRLKAFRTIKDEMADIIHQLNTSTAHAQKSILDFKSIVVAEEGKLTKKLKEASAMVDELDMINQTGSNLADRIEKGLTSGRSDKKSDTSHPFFEGEGAEHALSDKDDAEDDNNKLRESLRNVR